MGSVVVSVDAELGWGFHDRDPVPAGLVRRARCAWRDLLDLFDARDVPATWAVVGHLMLDRCDEIHAGHPAGDRLCADGSERGVAARTPSALRSDGSERTAGPQASADSLRSSAGGEQSEGLRAPSSERIESDGGSVVTADHPEGDLWFGDDLVDAVVAADAGHEVASHGFTHVHFEHDAMTRSFAAAELRACREAAVARGLDATSFVFPVNRVAHRDLLAATGFTCYRGRRPDARTGVGRVARKLVAAAADRGAPPVVTPTVDEHGLVNVPASLYLFGFDGPARALVERVREDPIVAQVRRGLDAVADRDDGVLHLWLHPHNLRTDRDRTRLRAVLAAVDEARAERGVRVETMGDVAARVGG